MTDPIKSNRALISTPSYRSSMENVKLYKDLDTGSITLTIIDDNSHGFRTFRLDKKDAAKIVEEFNRLVEE